MSELPSLFDGFLDHRGRARGLFGNDTMLPENVVPGETVSTQQRKKECLYGSPFCVGIWVVYRDSNPLVDRSCHGGDEVVEWGVESLVIGEVLDKEKNILK